MSITELRSYPGADPPLDSQRPANGGEQSTEQQVAKCRKRCLGSRCGTRVRGVLGSLHGLVTCLLQFRLSVIEPLGGLIVTNLHLCGHDVDNALPGRWSLGTTFNVGGEVARNVLLGVLRAHFRRIRIGRLKVCLRLLLQHFRRDPGRLCDRLGGLFDATTRRRGDAAERGETTADNPPNRGGEQIEGQQRCEPQVISPCSTPSKRISIPASQAAT